MGLWPDRKAVILSPKHPTLTVCAKSATMPFMKTFTTKFQILFAVPLITSIAIASLVATAACAKPVDKQLRAKKMAEKMGLAIPLYDPSGQALDQLHKALERVKKSKGQARLVFYGASHTSSDHYTGVIRRGLQKRYGDAGHGFIVAARPWRYYGHDDIYMNSTNTWRTDRIDKADAVPDGWYGLAGSSVASSNPEDYSIIGTQKKGSIGKKVDKFELWTLEQPGGGTLQVRIDKGPWREISTEAPQKRGGYHEFLLRDGPHSMEIRPKGDSEVRLFGVVLERKKPGVIVDSLGIPGSRAAYHLDWEDSLYREHLARRKPDFISLAYGTNEAGDDDQPIEEYEEALRKVMARIREIAPEASCLLIGPSDRPLLNEEDGTWQSRPRTAQVVEVQRKISVEFGCAFFDTVAFMGGDMSMPSWVNADPPVALRDHIHFTRVGYQRMGEVILNLLLPPKAKSPAKKK